MSRGKEIERNERVALEGKGGRETGDERVALEGKGGRLGMRG